VYRDFALLKNGFPGENLANGSVLVVKTHEWGPQARQPFNKAVLLGTRQNVAIHNKILITVKYIIKKSFKS
jgi:hypothetical protein